VFNWIKKKKQYWKKNIAWRSPFETSELTESPSGGVGIHVASRLCLILTSLSLSPSLAFPSSNSPSNSNQIAEPKPKPNPFPLFNSTFSMSLKPSNSSENLMLPVSDPPKSHDADDKLFKGSAMTKRGAFAAVSYMSCAGNLSSLLSIPPRSFVVNFFQFSVTL